ncbi:MAG: Ribosomal RNA large subunit methyltransferase G [Candidatus Celerinatantimonas neptuna]|nr:MAG: Ribosomal RNA large subunit methyltransferase G [Candidatus Celerinatantimonas neptuna]
MTVSSQNPFEQHLHLERIPRQHPENLKAWNAADELLVDYVEQKIPTVLTLALFNDDFGALSCALGEYQQHWYSDSWLAHQALSSNREANHLSPVVAQNTMRLAQSADVWLVKVPKTLAHLEHQLALISQYASPDQPIILAGMVKFLSRGVFALIEQYFGPLTTSLAKKKARLIFTRAQKPSSVSPYPKRWSAAPYPWQLEDHANVFCLGKLDIGSRFLIENLPDGNYSNIIDLGCGNGLLSLAALSKWPDAHLLACDESFMAVESTRTNLLTNSPDVAKQINVMADNGLGKQPDQCADLILCNPPFHQQQTIATHIARHMFFDAKRCLRAEGELCIVANRHLPYLPLLKKIFGQVKILASNRKFVILIAKKYHSRG